jgi:peptidoglycan/LPS O-acetylase OafA/YrhL
MKAPSRFHSLDALRGFAALSVVLVHWLFWLSDDNRHSRPGLTMSSLPGYDFLRFFYWSGDAAVGLFFSLSGFIFYWLYRDSIRARSVDGRQFVVARFSRLYPLHLATLLAVAAGQAAYASINHDVSWIFGPNDVPNFVKHLLIFPLWTPHRNFTFNTPVWTLIIEVLLYLVFFVVARWGSLRFVGTVVMLVVSYFARNYSNDISHGMTGFYMGGLAYLMFERIESGWVERVLRIVLGVSWPVAFILGCHYIDIARTPFAIFDGTYALYVLFPATILYLAVLEARRGGLGGRLDWLGELSYSSYLLHFPVMLAIALVFRATGTSLDLMLTLPALIAYFAALIPVSLACHRAVEQPVQDWLRGCLGRSNVDGVELALAASLTTKAD